MKAENANDSVFARREPLCRELKRKKMERTIQRAFFMLLTINPFHPSLPLLVLIIIALKKKIRTRGNYNYYDRGSLKRNLAKICFTDYSFIAFY